MAEATADFPAESRFRVVVEQAWSLCEFMDSAAPERIARMARLLRSGDVELTALFGNMTTELCGHEELIRCLYHSRRLARSHGFPVTTAEHNDVPGMSWGLSEVLAGAGVRFFARSFPATGAGGSPPCSPSGMTRRCSPPANLAHSGGRRPRACGCCCGMPQGSGGDVAPALPALAERLAALGAGGYPFESVYWPVRGGARDNSPYIDGFARAARDWNERWSWPRLLVSTNRRFYADLRRELPADLPVFRGDLPGPDYPVGSASTAAATATNRIAHGKLCSAEGLAVVAAARTDHGYPAETLRQADEESLWHDEHTWGYHFPAWTGRRASELEKAVHAMRAAALSAEAGDQALARFADHIALPGEGVHLVVFNPLPFSRTAMVSTPLRELDQTGSRMGLAHDPAAPEQDHLRGVLLTDRWHTMLPPDLLAGKFEAGGPGERRGPSAPARRDCVSRRPRASRSPALRVGSGRQALRLFRASAWPAPGPSLPRPGPASVRLPHLPPARCHKPWPSLEGNPGASSRASVSAWRPTRRPGASSASWTGTPAASSWIPTPLTVWAIL